MAPPPRANVVWAGSVSLKNYEESISCNLTPFTSILNMYFQGRLIRLAMLLIEFYYINHSFHILYTKVMSALTSKMDLPAPCYSTDSHPCFKPRASPPPHPPPPTWIAAYANPLWINEFKPKKSSFNFREVLLLTRQWAFPERLCQLF